MSVAAAGGAVSAHQPTSELIRLARLIEDKKHGQPEMQEIIRKVLDVVPNSNPEDALLALHDCDYDFEKAVALLIEKGHDVASEWRTATNHKTSKKQQQKSMTSIKNGQDRIGGEMDENAQYQQRKRDGSNSFKKSRGGRGKFPQQHQYNQQQDGADSQSTNQSNEHFNSQQKSRGGGSNYRGRNRGNRGGGVHRTNDRNRQQDTQDGSLDNSLPSDMAPRSNNVPYQNRRVDATSAASGGDNRQSQDHHFDVGNWNGETLIYSRTKKDDEQPIDIDLSSVSKSIQNLSETSGQQLSLGTNASKVNTSDTSSTAQSTIKSEFDPIEAAFQIKNSIGIGQNQGQKSATIPNTLNDGKLTINNQSTIVSNKTPLSASKSPGQASNNKATPTPPPRIPQQPVIFTDRFDGGLSKIDVQFGNLGEGFDETGSNSTINVSQSLTFYPKADPISSSSVAATSNMNAASSSTSHTQRSTTLAQHSSNEQSAFMPTTGSVNPARVSDQMPVMNQRLVSSQMQQQQQMAMKQVVPPNTYSIHQGQSQLNPQGLAYTSMLLHHPQQREAVALDNAYDPSSFPLTSDFGTASYYIQTALTSQQQSQGHYLVQQPTPQIQQVSTTRPSASNNAQTSANNSSSVTSTSTGAKKGPVFPPGLVVPGAAPAYPPTYGVSLPIGSQQQTGAASYPTIYDQEGAFNPAYMSYSNPQSAQSPTGVYGSVTPPVQQQNQQQGLHAGNDPKTLNMVAPITENLLMLQQYTLQHTNNQQQAQQNVTHAGTPINYYLGHPGNPTSYSPGHAIMYAAAATPMTQQQQPNSKQQGQHYNQRQTSSNKDGQFMYNPGSGQVSQGTGQSGGQHQSQQSGGNKQRANNNVYNNQQNQQRSYQ